MFSQGRWHMWAPEHPAAGLNGYVPNARLELETYLGRYLAEGTIVHHVNLDKSDDTITNLAELPGHREHAAAHQSIQTCAAELIRRGLIEWNGVSYDLSPRLIESDVYQEIEVMPMARADWMDS